MMGFWFRFSGAVQNIVLIEEKCRQYQERWLARVKRLHTDGFFSSEDAILTDFEERHSEGQVLQQRVAALFNTAADQMTLTHRSQSNTVADGLFIPMFYTTFVLDVNLEDSLVELFAESDDGVRRSLRVEAKKADSPSYVRYILHVDETPWSAPVSNQLCIHSCCAKYVKVR
jgi:hypothetical protein